MVFESSDSVYESCSESFEDDNDPVGSTTKTKQKAEKKRAENDGGDTLPLLSLDILPDDTLLQVYRYLNVRDRTRYELVSRRWARLLHRMWLSLKTLSMHQIIGGHGEDFDMEKRDRILGWCLQRCSPETLILYILPCPSPLFGSSMFARRCSISHELIDLLRGPACQHQLTHVDVSMHIFPNVHMLHSFLGSLPDTLEKFVMDYVLVDSNSEVEGVIANKALKLMFEKSSKLKYFSIKGRGSCYGYMQINEELMQSVPTNLRHLDISAGTSMKISKAYWASRLENLEHLSMERSRIDNHGLRVVVQSCPKLTHLNLAYSCNITNYTPIAALDALKCLTVDGNRDHFKNGDLEAITKNCKKLTCLSIENCNKLHSKLVMRHQGLKSISNLAELRVLSLNGLIELEDGALAEISLHCPCIQRLQMKYCRKVTKTGLKHLENLNKLESVFVNGILDFDAASAESLSKSSPNLVYIEALDCGFKMGQFSREGLRIVASI